MLVSVDSPNLKPHRVFISVISIDYLEQNRKLNSIVRKHVVNNMEKLLSLLVIPEDVGAIEVLYLIVLII